MHSDHGKKIYLQTQILDKILEFLQEIINMEHLSCSAGDNWLFQKTF